MRVLALALLLVLGVPAFAGATEYYKVTVTRVSQDLYRTLEGVYIKTRYCYEYVYSEDAILKWEGPGFMGSELIFVESGGTKCDVDRLLR